MKSRHFLLFLFPVLLSGCSGRGKTETDVKTINILDATISINEIAPYVHDVEVIHLSSDSVMIANISKLVVNDSEYILLAGNDVVAFDNTGKFLRRYGRLGNGPDEYTSVTDICVNDRTSELVCLTGTNQILTYNIQSGKIQNKIQLTQTSKSANAVLPYGDDEYLVFYSNPIEIVLVNGRGNQKEVIYSSESFFIPMIFRCPSTQSYDNRYVLSFSIGDGRVMISDGDEVSSPVEITFGNQTIPDDFFDGMPTPWAKVSELFEKDFYKLPNMCVTREQYSVSAFGRNSSVWNFVTDGQHGLRWQADTRNATPMWAIASDEESFYYSLYGGGCQSADILVSYLRTLFPSEFDVEDNPTLVRIKWHLSPI